MNPYRYILDPPKTRLSEGKHPLILFLHGAGERGDNFDNLFRHGPLQNENRIKIADAYVLALQCELGAWWSSERLHLTLIATLAGLQAQVDPRRIYLTGLSMGGFGSVALAASHPNLFAALLIVCGGVDPDSLTRSVSNETPPPPAHAELKRLTHLPAWLIHGALDPLVPVSQSQNLVKLLREAGHCELRYTEHPEGTHDVWTETYADPNVYNWLRSHEKKPE